MRHYIAPSTITPVILMGGSAEAGYQPIAGGTGNVQLPTQYSTATPTIAVADGTVGTLAAGQKMTLQNCGTAAVYVKRGTGASSSSFNWVLSACTAADDGLGGSVEIDDWIGAVSIDGVGTPRVAVTIFS
jgi:hypothetical protein